MVNPAAPSFITQDLDFAAALICFNFIPIIKKNGEDNRHLYEFPYSKYKEKDLRDYEYQYNRGELHVVAVAMSRARQRILSAQKQGRQL